MFTIYDVDYYPAVSIGEIPQILNHGYCYLLYDFGVLTETNYNELFGEGNDMQAFRKKYHLSMAQIPFFKNPFHIEKEQFPFLQELL